MKRILPTTGCAGLLVLLLATVNAWACGQGSGSSSITNLPTLGGSGFYAYAMDPAGQVTGVAYTTGNLAAHAFLYSGGGLTDLGTLGGSFSQGLALNALGQVAGEATVTGDTQLHAMLYNGTNMVDLMTLGGSYSSAGAINDAGQVAGRSLVAGDVDMDLFLYANGSMLDLGNLGGGSPSVAGINQLGSIAGDSYTAEFEYHALLYTNGTMLDLGTLGGLYSSAFALNDANVVVGESTTTNGQTHAFIYAAGAMTDLGTLGGTYSSARDVNKAGQVIGLAHIAGDLETHGFIFNSGTMTDLGTLGGTYVQPIALNNLGQVVGTAAAADGSYHAFLWQNGTLMDLNSLLPTNSGWVVSSGQLINDSGRVVGYGLYNGALEWFVLDLASSNQPPVAVAGPDQTVDCQAQVTLDGTGSSDPDGDTLAYEWSLGGSVLGTTPTLSVSLPLGTNVVTLTVTDPCGASAQTNVVVRVTDTTPPVVVSVPVPVPASADASCQAVVPNVVSQTVATDNCTAANALVISQAPLAGTVVGLGPHTIVVTVTDASGNSTTTNVVFSVVDTTPPVILSVPALGPVSAGTGGQGTVPDAASQTVAADNCSAVNALVITQAPVAGSLAGLGPHTIVVTVTDAAGNGASTNVVFTVVDTTPPVILSVPVGLSVSADANCQGAVPDVVSQTVATDNCTAVNALVITQAPVPGTVVGLGPHTIVVTVTDAAGNSVSTNVVFTVADTTPPTITSLTVSPSVISPPNHQMVPVTVSVTAFDNCDPAPVSQIVSIASNDPQPGDNQITGALTASLLAEKTSTGDPKVYTLTVQCTDASGNSSTGTVTVTVQKNGNKK